MKTRDRILVTSLLLFNEEGEPNVTTVDISNELEISPGNLYYHFKGKEAIIEELYARFEEEMTGILRAPLEQDLSVEDSWFYLYVVFEEIYNIRFLYENLTDILRRYPNIGRKFKRLINQKQRTAEAVIEALAEHGIIEIDPEEIPQLCENLTLTLTWWLTHADLRGHSDIPPIMIHQGVFQIVHNITPYLSEEYEHLVRDCRELYESAVSQLTE